MTAAHLLHNLGPKTHSVCDKHTPPCPLLQPRTVIVSGLLVQCGKIVIYGRIKTGVRRIRVVLESELNLNSKSFKTQKESELGNNIFQLVTLVATVSVFVKCGRKKVENKRSRTAA